MRCVGRGALVVLLAAGAAGAEEKRKDPGRGINFYSLEKEMALGRSLAQDIELRARIIDDPVVSEYVNRLGQNLVRNSDAKVPFTIKVIDSEEVNAIALPGGFFYVHSELILRTESEAELAGVMAHEVAHVAARHATRQATRGQIVNFASLPLIFMGGWTGYAIRQAAGVGLPLTFLKFTRSFEREADYLGLQYLHRTGYDPTAFVDFFERLETAEKKKPGAIAKAFSTHPLTDSRVRRAQKEIREILEAKPEYVVSTSEYERVKQRLRLLANRHEVPGEGRPHLRRRPAARIDTESSRKPQQDEERPKLKRRN